MSPPENDYEPPGQYSANQKRNNFSLPTVISFSSTFAVCRPLSLVYNFAAFAPVAHKKNLRRGKICNDATHQSPPVEFLSNSVVSRWVIGLVNFDAYVFTRAFNVSYKYGNSSETLLYV